MLLSIALLAGSFTLSLVLTFFSRKYALQTGFVSKPAKDRFSEKIVALGGGIAIFTTLATLILSAIAIVKFLAAPGHLDWLGESTTIHIEGFLSKIDKLMIILALVSALFLLGLWDDKKHLGPFFKLIVQFIIAICAAYFADIRVEFFIESKIITSLLSAFWIVFIINSFNFLDNMDGLSAGIAVITSSIFFSIAALNGQIFISGIAIVFIGTLLGFLVYNFPPAKIYMGDAGSLVIGFFIAILSLRTTYYNQSQSGRWYSVLVPLIVLAVPLYDFISVTLLRITQGKSPFVGDTQHFSHRIRKHGFSDTQTALILYLATLCTGLGASFLSQVNLAGAILIFIQTLMILSIIAVFEMTSTNEKNNK
ncbi:MAG: undecaprenyl/decaprenyl-phosphate alpha-N-acetylglucosaminyl 1-phosphate transferase [Sedimentisphaerales bacterium]|nr:undecaprenyl/decaprenyl-phosphate alpha-N-acetylglucosaminyl 1-phosphate transferase [Sedimentisphaerales bacterium]